MKHTEIIHVGKRDLNSYTKTQLQQIAKHLQLPTELAKDDLAWVIAITLFSDYKKANMGLPTEQYSVLRVKVDYGKFADQLSRINKQYHNIAARFQKLADEAGVGTAAPHRHFDGESFIQYAIDNDITNLSIDDIYAHQIAKKMQAAAEELGITDYPISKSGKQCTSDCTVDTHDSCYCSTKPYSTWFGTYKWDYCKPEDCVATRTINIVS